MTSFHRALVGLLFVAGLVLSGCATTRKAPTSKAPFADLTADLEALENRTAAGATRGFWRLTASRGDFYNFQLQDIAVDEAGRLALVKSGARMAEDPFEAGSFDGGNFYNGGRYRYGVATSPVLEVEGGFQTVVPHFEVETPPGTWITVRVSARVDGVWSRNYVMAVWASDDSTIKRHSVNRQSDSHGRVDTDTLVLSRPADALRMTVALFSAGESIPSVRALGAIARPKPAAAATAVAPLPPADRSTWGTVLDVPERSQMLYPGGDVWCSPTATTMVIDYWARKLNQPDWVDTVPVAASRTYDWVYRGTGNWPFNTAYASSRTGGRLGGFITRLASLSQVEALVRAGVPVILSIRYDDTLKLDGAPLPFVRGHLLVVRGFDAEGNVIANDPAFPSDDKVRTVYRREQFERSWAPSSRTAYVIYPDDFELPEDPLGLY